MACSKPWNKSCVEEEKNCNITYFFRDLIGKRIAFQIPRSETKDIIEAVDCLVQIIIAKVTTDVRWFRSFSRLVKVGSMAERTSISIPDEFDYLLVSKQDGVEVERVCKWRKSYAHIRVTDPNLREEWGPFLSGDYLRGSFTRDFCSASLPDILQYLRSVGKKWLRRNSSVEDGPRSLWNSYFDSIGNAFMLEVNRVIQDSDYDLVYETASGTLRVEKYVGNHGPALMPKFIWIPRTRKRKLTITVDIAIAIEVNLLRDKPVIQRHDTFHPQIWDALEKHGKYMLIPCHESAACAADLCFRLTFTETEVEIVHSMSHHHKECYMLLKYIFNGGGGISFIPSYALKTIVVKHNFFCSETENLSRCFKTLVASLLFLLDNREIVTTLEPSTLMRLYIPGCKFKLNIPSLFIEGHNILDSKDYIVPAEQLLLSIEEMLESLEKIGTEGSADMDTLKLVNNHSTAAKAYGVSMFPYPKILRGQPLLKHCWRYVEVYFKPYGRRHLE